jgi:predicted Zn-dependent protease
LLQEKKRDRSEITATLEKGVSTLPSSAVLRGALAQEYVRSGKPDSALKLAQTGASANNAGADAIALLAGTYEQVGDTKMAIETYRKLATDYPQRSDWRLRLAELEASATVIRKRQLP